MMPRRRALLGGLVLPCLLLTVSTARANDNPALGIGEPNTPFEPPCDDCPCKGLKCDDCKGSGSPVMLNNGQL